MTKTEHSPEQRRKNIRLAWILVGFALFMMLTSVPFWSGLFELATSSAP